MKWIILGVAGLVFAGCAVPKSEEPSIYLAVPWGRGENRIYRGCDVPDCNDIDNYVNFAVGPHGEVAVGDWGGTIKLFTRAGKLYDTVQLKEDCRGDITFDDSGGLYYLDVESNGKRAIVRFAERRRKWYFVYPDEFIDSLERISVNGGNVYALVYLKKPKAKKGRLTGLVIGDGETGARSYGLVKLDDELETLLVSLGRTTTGHYGSKNSTLLGVDGRGTQYVNWAYHSFTRRSEVRVYSSEGTQVARFYVRKGICVGGSFATAKMGRDGRLYIDVSDNSHFRLACLTVP
jgi:hypothetical protein